MFYSQETIDAIRDRAFEVMEFYLGTLSSRDPNALCPFHDDKKPSMYVNPDGLWYCHPCGIGGDVITFVRQFCHLDSFPEAVAECLRILGVSGVTEQQSKETFRLRKLVTEARRVIADWYSEEIRLCLDRAWSCDLKGDQPLARHYDEKREDLESISPFVAFDREMGDAGKFFLEIESWEEFDYVRRALADGDARRQQRREERNGPGLFGSDEEGKGGCSSE